MMVEISAIWLGIDISFRFTGSESDRTAKAILQLPIVQVVPLAPRQSRHNMPVPLTTK
jgi:hypothetical protein